VRIISWDTEENAQETWPAAASRPRLVSLSRIRGEGKEKEAAADRPVEDVPGPGSLPASGILLPGSLPGIQPGCGPPGSRPVSSSHPLNRQTPGRNKNGAPVSERRNFSG